MLIRLLGKEGEAGAYAGDCPLRDVAGRWMAPYVGWAWEAGITKGVSETAFDPDGAARGKMYAAFVLRALGYSEEAGDFTYNDAVAAAAEKKVPVKVGSVFTSDQFYNANARANEQYRDMGILAVEMETAGIYWEAMASHKKALSLLTISDHIFTGEALSAEERQNSFTDMMEVALETALEIAE